MILEHDPFFIIEAMTIAGIATGCEHGYLYLRGEYPLAWDRLVTAITAARARGFLGQDILGQGDAFDIELRKGAAPTSAARRPRCSTRSRGIAASRATSRRSPSTRACSTSRP